MVKVTFDNDARRLKFATFFHAATPFCRGRPRLWGCDTTTAMLRHATPAVGDNVVTNLLTTVVADIDVAVVDVTVAVGGAACLSIPMCDMTTLTTSNDRDQ